MRKPEIFKPQININNNKKVYYSYVDDRLGIERNDESVSDFIDNLSKNNSYMFSKSVIIRTNEKIYDTKIAGRIGNKVITLDNDSININDIEDISFKK